MPVYGYKPTLQINGDEVPIASFNFSAPAGNLGTVADVVVADKSLSFDRGSTFTLTIRNLLGSGTPKTRLIKDGRVLGDTRSIGINRGSTLAPNDSYSLKATDAIGEKHKLSPRIPITLFNPNFITLEENATDSGVNDENGDRIEVVVTAVNDLDLEYILNYVYVTKCGFSEVVHNLPNYAIPRVDFSLNSSFHNIAKSFYGNALFAPVFFEDDGRFFIIDIYGELPEGIISGARTVNASKYVSYSKTNPDVNVVNAVLLSHKEVSIQSLTEDEFPEDVTQRTETDPPHDIGTPGSIGWQSTQVRRFVAEIHDDADDVGKITSEIVWKIETRTQGRDEDGIVRDLMVETQTEFYTNSWRLKVGYQKQTSAYVDTGDGSKAMQDVQTENGRILWRPSVRNPGEWEKYFTLVQVEGLVVIEGDEDEDPEGVAKTPLLEASRAGAVPDDESATITRLPISTTTQVWRDTGPDQIQVLITKLDQLTGRPEQSGTTEHVGTNSVRVRSGESINTRQVLLTDPDSDLADGAREPISFDAGYVTYEIAKELALRALEHAKSPKPTISCQLASLDAGIRRGSVRNIVDRLGNEVVAIITGYSVTGTQAERGQIVISQSIEGVAIG